MLEKQKTPGNWKGFFVVSKILIFLSLFVIVSCGKKPIPACPKCKIYAGDSSQGAVVRAQDNEVIYANDPEFDNMVAMSAEGFKAFVQTYVYGCRQWKTRRLTPAIKSDVYRKNKPQLKLVQKQLKKK